MASRKPLGILAGGGRMPLIAAQTIVAGGRDVIGVQIAETGQTRLAKSCREAATFSIGQAGAILEFFRMHGVREVLLAGKVDKDLNFAALDFDETAMAMLARLPGRQDMALFGVVADELRARGIRIAKQTEVLADLLAPEGQLAGPALDDDVARDIAFGFEVATTLAGFDVGQTVVVKQGAVVAIEAFEHTDACVLRAGKLAGAGLVVCKVSRPRQDPRFDVPTIGPATLRVMQRAGAACLAVEAGATLMLDPKATYAAATEFGISFIGVSRSV